MNDLDTLKNSGFPDLQSQEPENSSVFSRYDNEEYVASEMRNLITISLTHCPHLVNKIKENSAESNFLKENFGIDYPCKTPVNEDQTPATIVTPAPVHNTLMHSFNHSSASGDPSTSQETLKNIEKLHQKSTVTRDIVDHKYRTFGEILDDLFPDWKENEQGLALEEDSSRISRLTHATPALQYKEDDDHSMS